MNIITRLRNGIGHGKVEKNQENADDQTKAAHFPNIHGKSSSLNFEKEMQNAGVSLPSALHRSIILNAIFVG
jgi:hypothetical protein